MYELDARLTVGASKSATVQAHAKWNRAGVLVESGERYELRASGAWTDLFIETDPKGFTTDEAPRLTRGFLRRFEGERRMPAERWFCLVGCVGEEGAPFVIGTQCDWTVPVGQSGPLLAYANDVHSAYWNNRGAVQLLARRLA